jgi:hypothetical protein
VVRVFVNVRQGQGPLSESSTQPKRQKLKAPPPPRPELNLSLTVAPYRTLVTSAKLTPSELTLEDRVLASLSESTTEIGILDAFNRIRTMLSKGMHVSLERFDNSCSLSRERHPGKISVDCRSRLSWCSPLRCCGLRCRPLEYYN